MEPGPNGKKKPIDVTEPTALPIQGTSQRGVPNTITIKDGQIQSSRSVNKPLKSNVAAQRIINPGGTFKLNGNETGFQKDQMKAEG